MYIYFLREDHLNTYLDKLGPKVTIEIQTHLRLETGENFRELTSIWVMAPRWGHGLILSLGKQTTNLLSPHQVQEQTRITSNYII
jgi:hypothetical protein